MNIENKVKISSEQDIVTARRVARIAAQSIGFNLTDMTRIVTATSELARNIFNYAGSGFMTWRKINLGNKIGIELIFEDNGPGIPDIDLAMQEGYSTSGGLGMGLPGTKRLMDEMEIRSEVGKGTTVTIRKWLR